MAAGSLLVGARNAFENLNEREQRLVTVLGVILVCAIIVLPMVLMTRAMGDLATENEEIQRVLRDIARSRTTIAEQQAEQRAREQRYDHPAPQLGTFVEEKARTAGYDRPPEVSDQPELVVAGYSRRYAKVTLPNVGMKTAADMMAAIENSPHPVAIHELSVDHFRTGDSYNVTVGVIAFDRRGGSSTERTPADRPPRRGAGPPAP